MGGATGVILTVIFFVRVRASLNYPVAEIHSTAKIHLMSYVQV